MAPVTSPVPNRWVTLQSAVAPPDPLAGQAGFPRPPRSCEGRGAFRHKPRTQPCGSMPSVQTDGSPLCLRWRLRAVLDDRPGDISIDGLFDRGAHVIDDVAHLFFNFLLRDAFLLGRDQTCFRAKSCF